MNDIDLLHLDESSCKAVLDFLVKQTYGDDAEVYIRKSKIGYDVILNIKNNEFYMLGYIDGVLVTTFNGFNVKDFTWKYLLNTIENFVQKSNAYISYLDNKPHLIDNSVSIEEVLINLDLKPAE